MSRHVFPRAEEVDIRPQHYQRLTEKIAGKPEERILSYLMLRSLKQARYAADPLGHFALAVAGIHAFHFADPPLSGLDRSSRAEMGAGKSAGCAGAQRVAAGRDAAGNEIPSAQFWARTGAWSSRKLLQKAPRPSAARTPPSAN